MTFIEELRPCMVNGAQALFHGWAEIISPVFEEEDKFISEYKTVNAIVEFHDGHVEAVNPTKIKFLDSQEKFKEYGLS